MVQALIARGVVGDFRAGGATGEADLLRFGFTPLYTRFTDVPAAVDALVEVLVSGDWRAPGFQRKGKVT
jgi:kynureninase